MIRKFRLAGMDASAYPSVEKIEFDEWKSMEMASINICLWATWGVFLITIAVAFLLTDMLDLHFSQGGAEVFQLASFVAFIILLVKSSITGSKAAKMRKRLGIKFP